MRKALRFTPAMLAAACLQAAAPPVLAQYGVSAQSSISGVGLAGGLAPASAATVRVDLAGGAASRSISIPRGKSAIIELPVDARDVLVTNPAVAEAVLRSPRRIYVLGMAAGQTDAVFFDAAGRRILSLDIRVDQDVGALEDTLARVLPGSKIRIEAINDSVILTGLVLTPSDADKAAQIAARFVARPEQVLNMLSVAGKDQVSLRVRIVEVQRNVIKQLGLSTDIVSNNGSRFRNFERENTYGANGSLMGGATTCGGQNGARTTNNNNTNTTNTTNSSGSDLTNTNSSSLTNTNSSNATNTNSSNLTNTDSSSVTWTNEDNPFPGNVTLLDVNGNPVVVPGVNIATFVGSGLGGVGVATSATSSVASTLNSTVGSALTSTVGSTLTNTLGSAVSNVVNNVASTAYSTITGMNSNTCLDAFERVGLVRTLAEPTLTAVSGESAKFLAGGEYPVPTGQDNTGKVTIEFKPYGVGLGFTPVVLSGGRISLKVSTEVSELTNQGAFTMQASPGSPGLSIAALKVRRAESTVELPSGGSLMMAGLLQESVIQNIDSLPGMTNMPVLGALFRSRDYLSGQTELVVIVTPYIVDPTAPQDMQTPADGLRIASDAETILLGRLNKAVKAPPQANAGRTWQGPIGYVIE